MKTRIIIIAIAFVTGVFGYGMMYLMYWLNKSHIEGLQSLGIQLSFRDQIYLGFGLFKWWAFAIVVVAILFGVFQSKKIEK